MGLVSGVYNGKLKKDNCMVIQESLSNLRILPILVLEGKRCLCLFSVKFKLNVLPNLEPQSLQQQLAQLVHKVHVLMLGRVGRLVKVGQYLTNFI